MKDEKGNGTQEKGKKGRQRRANDNEEDEEEWAEDGGRERGE